MEGTAFKPTDSSRIEQRRGRKCLVAVRDPQPLGDLAIEPTKTNVIVVAVFVVAAIALRNNALTERSLEFLRERGDK